MRPRTFRLVPLGVLLAALACSPANPVEEARALQREGRSEEAIALLREAVEASPGDPELNYFYGLALLKDGQHSAAHWPLRRAMEDPEWQTQAGMPLATSLLALSNTEAAIEVLDEILEREPENGDALVARAKAKVLSRVDYEGALEDLDRLAAVDPDDPRILAPRAAALLGLERLDEVAEALEDIENRILEEDLDAKLAGHYCLTRATFRKEKGELARAREAFEECLEKAPTDEVVTKVVEFYDEIGDRERPMEILREALERAPQATLYRTALATRLEARGDVEEAEQLLIAGLDVGGAPDFVVWANLSGHYQRQERFAKAVEAFEKVMASTPEPPPAMVFEFAEILVLAGEYDRALQTADGMEIPAMRELIHGRVHYERGQYEAALERLEAGLVLWPDNAIARYFAARCAEQLGRFDDAIDQYRYAVRADPAATDARHRLARIRLAEGNLGDARTEAIQASDRNAPDFDAELAVLERMAETADLEALLPLLARLSQSTENADPALVATAAAVARTQGAAAAVRFLDEAPGLDLTRPRFAGALDAWVGYQLASGQAGARAAEQRVAAALAAHPESAAILAVEAHRLERSGAGAEPVARAYERALARDAAESRALAGMARLAALAGDREAELSWLRKAAASTPESADAQYRVVTALLALERDAEARDALEALLRSHPLDARAAIHLGRMLLRPDGGDEAGGTAGAQRALELGERAARFRGGEPARALISAARERLAPPS